MPERDLKPYALVLSCIFAAAFLAGAFAPPPARQEVTRIFRFVDGTYRDLAGGTLFLLILANNVIGSFLTLLFGLFLGIVPVMSVASNGLILGVLCRQAGETQGYAKAALAVLPHGIFEIPALLIAASYGLRLGAAVLRLARRKESTPIGPRLLHAVRRYFVVVFPLLVLAAAIETALLLAVS